MSGILENAPSVEEENVPPTLWLPEIPPTALNPFSLRP